MRLLLYNWVPFDDARARGGGVRIYQENLVGELRRRGTEIVSLSAGTEFDLRASGPRLEEMESARAGVRSFRILNSQCPAPGHFSYDTPELLRHSETTEVFAEFLRRHGPFDVIQFDSLEGLPFSVLPVAREHAQAKVGVYAHNYFAVCPQVNLWKHEYEHCDDFDDGLGCVGCVWVHASTADALRRYRADRALERVGLPAGSIPSEAAIHALRFGRKLIRVAQRQTPLFTRKPVVPEPTAVVLAEPSPENLAAADRFAHRRTEAVRLLNECCDLVLATSERTKEVLVDRGVESELVKTCYIGTAHAEAIDESLRRTDLRNPDRLRVAYLGYARRDKGFYFLLDALESADPSLLSRLDLVLAAKMPDPSLPPRIKRLEKRLGSLELIAGYKHGDLPSLLGDVDLGVVPVQWEDNLPQVAIEFVCLGVPILTSNRGGAQELGGRNPLFTFEAGNTGALLEQLTRLADGRTKLVDYWPSAMRPVVMRDHVDRLLTLYEMS